VSGVVARAAGPGSLLERVVERSDAEAVPLEVLFEITHRCNLPCTHCYLPSHTDEGELSFAEIEALLDELARAGVLFLTLTGGEVFARRDFLDIVDAAVARGFVVKVLTNGTMISDEAADRLARAGVLEVSISVYGVDAEAHDRVTEQPGSHARTLEGIERLRARGLHVVMKTPVLGANVDSVRGLHALARQQNIPCRFDLAITAKTNGDPGPLALALRHQEMLSLLTDETLGPELMSSRESDGPSPCSAGRSYAAIGPTGDVLPCIQMPVVTGNVRREAFSEIWRNAPFLQRLRGLTVESLTACQSCSVKGSCSRCPGSAYVRGQDVTGCDLTARQVARARVEARLRLPVV
jgi:radical SAM protein with 4Fe4S-binding SPASM domain